MRRPADALARLVPGVAGVVVALAILEVLPAIGVVSESNFPPITDDLSRLGDLVQTGPFWSAVSDTVQGWALGLAIASAIAIPLGIVLGSIPILYHALRVVIEFLRPIPSVALIPLAVVLYGTGIKSTLFLVIFSSLWPILIAVMYGVQDVDPVATDTARSFGFGRLSCLWRITLPSALPFVATGLRIAVAVALVLAITAGIVIGTPGLGQAITVAQQSGAYEVMYALIIATGILGWGANTVLEWGETRVLRWHTAHRPGGVG